MFLFEERLETFFRRSEGLGIDLRRYHESGRLLIRDFNPAEISPGRVCANRRTGRQRIAVPLEPDAGDQCF
jgi:hypothetical protein